MKKSFLILEETQREKRNITTFSIIDTENGECITMGNFQTYSNRGILHEAITKMIELNKIDSKYRINGIIDYNLLKEDNFKIMVVTAKLLNFHYQ